MTDDDDCRRTILSRRARFIAAALASAGLTAASCNKSNVEANPQPCLSAPPPRYDVAPPQPCLEMPMSDDGAPPQPLTPPPEPPPQVCLSPMPTPEDAGAPQPPRSGKVPS